MATTTANSSLRVQVGTCFDCLLPGDHIQTPPRKNGDGTVIVCDVCWPEIALLDRVDAHSLTRHIRQGLRDSVQTAA